MMPEKPERVAVVGAGISGLATAFALALTGAVKPEAIDVFEARTGPDTGLGGAVNLTGGSGVLYHKFGIDLRPISSPLSRVIGRSLYDSNKPVQHARLLFDFDVEGAVMRHPSKRTLLLDSNGQSLFVTVMREDLQRVLFKETADAGVNIYMGCNIKAVLPDGVLQFTRHDGDHQSDNKGQEQYDLIIGADGVRSVVRDAVMSSLSTSSKSANSKSMYSGFRVLWGIEESSCEDIENPPFGTIHQFFGNGLYLLHYGAGPRESRKRLMVGSFQDSRTRGENVNYRFNSEDALREEARKLLLAAGFPEEIRRTFDMSQRFIDTPVYEYPTKKTSCSVHRVVLVGDAAHAMAPFLGQGANQGIQDAYVLAAAIASIGKENGQRAANQSASRLDSLLQAIKVYDDIRRGPTQALVQSSRGVGLLETQGGFVGTTFRNNAFAFAGATGLLQAAFLSAADPRMGQFAD